MVIIMGWRISIWTTKGEALPRKLSLCMDANLRPPRRLQSIHEKTRGKVEVVLHGTNEFPPDIMSKCIERGVTRINANKLVLSDYNDYIDQNTGKVPLTQLIEEGTMRIQKQMERWMDNIESSGKA
jgi:fructose-bisphosphate aldolase class II